MKSQSRPVIELSSVWLNVCVCVCNWMAPCANVYICECVQMCVSNWSVHSSLPDCSLISESDLAALTWYGQPFISLYYANITHTHTHTHKTKRERQVVIKKQIGDLICSPVSHRWFIWEGNKCSWLAHETQIQKKIKEKRPAWKHQRAGRKSWRV